MKDADLRGLVLQAFYDQRHQTTNLGLNQIIGAVPSERILLANICRQLAEHSLIKWHPIGGAGQFVDGVGNITAKGVDVVEGTTHSPITVTLHDHSISVAGSTNVQIGNANVQGVSFNISKLIAAIDHSSATEMEKKEAKSLIERIASSPLLQTVLATVFGSGAST